MQSRRRPVPFAVPVVMAVLAGVLLAGCGSEVRGTLGESRVENLAPQTSAAALPPQVRAPVGDVRTRGPVTVIDAGEGPQLCAGPVAESFPPQCSGPEIRGWQWSKHPHEKKGGVRWTTVRLQGAYDTEAFTLGEVISDDAEPGVRPGDDHLETPCPVPAGGWAVVDSALTNSDSLESAQALAADFEGTETWLDPTGGGGMDVTEEFVSEAPGWIVLNVATAGDVEDVERELREVWGGKLCVTNSLRTDSTVERALRRLPGLLTTWTARNGAAVVEVLYDDGTLQAWVDQTYGVGIVEVVSALVPLT